MIVDFESRDSIFYTSERIIERAQELKKACDREDLTTIQLEVCLVHISNWLDHAYNTLHIYEERNSKK